MATRAKGKVEEQPESDRTQSVFVMQLKKEGKSVAHFATGVDDDEDTCAFKDAYMPHSDFVDMGKPTEITVTIVPGDKL